MKTKLNRGFAWLMILVLLLTTCTADPTTTEETDTPESAAVSETAFTESETASTEDSSGGYTAGVYEGVGQGMGGDVQVSVTFSETAIESIEIGSHGETEGVCEPAIEGMPTRIIEAQSLAVDTVTGATLTSNAILEAVESCVEQAGGDVEALKQASEQNTASTAEIETVSVDLVVVGGGASGTVAAISAAEAGIENIMLVEKTSVLGGNGNAAQGMFAVGSVLQEQAGVEASAEYYFDKLTFYNNYMGDPILQRMDIEESASTVQWVLDHNIAMYLSEKPQQIAHFDEPTVYHRWNDTDPFVHFAEYLEQYNVDVRFETAGESIIKGGNGEVTGIIARKADGSTLQVNAKAVVIATGGYAGDETMMRNALGNLYDTISIVASTVSDGTGIRMAYEAGASADGTDTVLAHGISMGLGTDTPALEQVVLNLPTLWVNRNGKRFMNEELVYDTVTYTSAVLSQGGFCYTVYDQATLDAFTVGDKIDMPIHYWDRFGIDGTIYHATLTTEDIETGMALGTEAGSAFKADTIEELATMMGMDPETFVATVNDYNSYIAAGKDSQFFKSADSLKYSVETGPYYAFKGVATCLGALGGVNVNEKLEACDIDDQPIPGLYVTGADAGGMYNSEYSPIEGIALGFALTSGRVAGGSAAEYIASK